MTTVTVNVSGPLFSAGRQATVTRAMLRECEHVLGDRLYAYVQANLAGSLRNPTGAYQARIRTRRMSDRTVVTDDRSVKGPWLEGTSSRNQTTRFKGYASFRRARQSLDHVAAADLDAVVRRHVARLQ